MLENRKRRMTTPYHQKGKDRFMIAQMAIFSATLGLSAPWQVTSATFAKESNRLDINIEYAPVTSIDCPFCGKPVSSLPSETMLEVWHHEDFFRYTTYLHAKVPVMTCCGRSFPQERPWSRVGSKFFRLTLSAPPRHPAVEGEI